MKNNQQLISILTEKEQVEFIQHLKKKNKTKDEKNIQLFKLILNEPHLNNYVDRIYPERNKNAFHALSKRLQDSLVDFIAIKAFENENSAEQELFKKILAARILVDHQNYKFAFKLLQKAESKAKQLELYSILREVFITLLQFAHHYEKINVTELKLKIAKNQQHLDLELRLQLVEAELKLSAKNNKILDSAYIEKLLQQHQIEIKEELTFKALLRLFAILDLKSQLESNYFANLKELEKLYALVHQKQHLQHRHHYEHLQILQLLSYAYFRSRDFKHFKKYLDKFEQLLEQNLPFRNQFDEDLFLLKAYYFNFTGKASEAIQLLETQKTKSFLPRLFLMTCYIQQNEIKKAYQTLQQLHQSDLWYAKHHSEIWIIKKNLIELILLVELDNYDVFESRLHSFQKKYYKKLQSTGNERVIVFTKLTTDFYLNQNFDQQQINILENSAFEKEDIFMICFYAWLKAKVESKDLYGLTLELVNN